jgi:hypothetical protein
MEILRNVSNIGRELQLEMRCKSGTPAPYHSALFSKRFYCSFRKGKKDFFRAISKNVILEDDPFLAGNIKVPYTTYNKNF